MLARRKGNEVIVFSEMIIQLGLEGQPGLEQRIHATESVVCLCASKLLKYARKPGLWIEQHPKNKSRGITRKRLIA